MKNQVESIIDEEGSINLHKTNIKEMNSDLSTTIIEEEKKDSESVLQNAIMEWTKKQQQDYLKSRKLPIHGTKMQLADRIMSKISIKDAIIFTREYKAKKKEAITTTEGKQGTNLAH